MPRINVGIIGYRNHSLKIINVLLSSHKIGKIFCYCYKVNKRKILNEKNKNDKIIYLSNLKDLYISDLFFITSPSNTHFHYIKKLIKIKKPIFCEKTGFTTAKQLLYLKNLNSSQISKIYFNYNFIFTKLFKDIEKLIKDKKDNLNHLSINVTNGIYSLKKFKNNWRFTSNSPLERITGNLGSHYLHFLITLFGKPLNIDIFEKVNSLNKIHSAIINIKFKKNITSTLFFSYNAPMINKLELIFDNKIVTLNDLEMNIHGPRDTFDKKGLFKTPKKIERINYNKNMNEVSLKNSINFFVKNSLNKKSFSKYYMNSIIVSEIILLKKI